MMKLFGIVEYLGECKETGDISLEMKGYIPSDKFNLDKYKAFKPLSATSGARVFKGFTDANTLASISKTNEDYQRAIDKKHSKEIEQFIIKSSVDRFYFPEVTLLYEYDPTVEPEKLPLKSVVDMFANKKDIEIISMLGAIGVYSLEIADGEKLYRLDGNHRLEALGKCAKEGLSKTFKQNKMVSFCIILTPKTDGYSFEHLYFYLLNSKALPIHSLKTLEIITQANQNGEMKPFIENDTFLSIMNQTKECWDNFNNSEKEVLISVVGEIIATQKISNLVNVVKESVGIYIGEKHSQENTEAQMLGAICWLRLKSKDSSKTKENLIEFKKWVNHFKHEIANFKKFGDLYEAFVKYDIERRRKRQIFVAMEFEQNYKAIYKSAIENVIQRIKGRNSHIDLDLMKIMEQKGDVVISQKIFDDIDKCDIFIADISTNNINVMLEYGFAKGKSNEKNKKYIIVFYSGKWNDEVLKELEKIETQHIQKIKSDLKNKPFDIRVNNHNKWKDKDELEKKLEQEFENYLKENQLS